MEALSDKMGGRFKTAMAFMIAFVTVMSAVAAWRASLAAGDAGNADTDGLAATVHLEESQALNSLTAYQHYRAFTTYLRYSKLGDLFADDMAKAEGDQADTLKRQKEDAYTVAQEIQGQFFESRYLNPDNGNYDVDRELGGLLADDERQQDVAPAPHFDKADHLRSKSTWLIAVLVAFAIALWFFSLAEAMRHVFKYVLALGGFAFTFFGVVALLGLELLY